MNGNDIGMTIGIGKCVILTIKWEKRETTETIDLSNEESIITLEMKENWLYFRILEADTIKKNCDERKKIVPEYKKTSQSQALLQKGITFPLERFLGQNLQFPLKDS